jgi:MFS superfamily sulfate permease-like transporter
MACAAVETIGTRFGGIPQSLPVFAWPEPSWESVQQLFIPTLTIAVLGAIESLLCARVADNLIPYPHHDPNQELMAQGVANVVVPFFGGIPATGTIARTVTNVRAGAVSPVAGIIHAATLLLIVLVAAPLAVHVPLAVLAGILLFVAFNMGEWHEFGRLRRFSVEYRTKLIATFLLTVMVDLTVAMEVGLVLACLFFVYRMSTLFGVENDHSAAPACESAGSTARCSSVPSPSSNGSERTCRAGRGGDPRDAPAGLDRFVRARRPAAAAPQPAPPGRAPSPLRSQCTTDGLVRQAEFDAVLGLENLHPT